MAVWVAGIEMIHRDPIQLGSEVILHLAHHVTGEGAQIEELVAALWRNNEAELMAVFPPAFHKLPSVRRVGLWPMESSAFSFPGGSIALQIAQMGVGSLTSALQPDDARFDHDAAHPLAWAALLR
jgi:hypothetical protein